MQTWLWLRSWLSELSDTNTFARTPHQDLRGLAGLHGTTLPAGKGRAGTCVQDPTDAGSSLQGSVLTATVVERVKKGKQKGKYKLQISGVVPSGKGGKYVERDNLQLMGSQYVSAETIKKYRLFTEDQAADYLVTG